MAECPPKPPELPWLQPYLAVAEVERSMDFYERAFGFERANALRDRSGEVVHAALVYRDSRILIGVADRSVPREADGETLGRTPSSLGGTGLVLYLFTEDVDALYKRAIEAGAKEGFPPEDMFWGDRICLLFDPDGHAWNFATHKFDYPEGG